MTRSKPNYKTAEFEWKGNFVNIIMLFSYASDQSYQARKQEFGGAATLSHGNAMLASAYPLLD
jgi:hypothetical protein